MLYFSQEHEQSIIYDCEVDLETKPAFTNLICKLLLDFSDGF